MIEGATDRRPIESRQWPAMQRLAKLLARNGVTPNQISIASIVMAAAGAASLTYAPDNVLLFVPALLFIQLRLVCNLLDGIVAVEHGKGTPLGSLYNEFPDRISDTLLIVALGYAAAEPSTGWAAALAAALTAYVRLAGGSLGLPQSFNGVMAKQRRMALMSALCLMAPVEQMLLSSRFSLSIGLWVLLCGSLWTCVTRTQDIAERLQQRFSDSK